MAKELTFKRYSRFVKLLQNSIKLNVGMFFLQAVPFTWSLHSIFCLLLYISMPEATVNLLLIIISQALYILPNSSFLI